MLYDPATIICLIVGVICLVVEMFTPGLGVPGALGILALFAAVMLQIGNPIGVLFMLALVLFLIAIAVIVFFKLVGSSRFDQAKIVLNDKIDGESTNLSDAAVQSYVGRIGMALTPLRPSGKAVFEDYTTLDVSTSGEFLPSGARLEIVEAEGLRILVRAIAEDDVPATTAEQPIADPEAAPFAQAPGTEEQPDAVL